MIYLCCVYRESWNAFELGSVSVCPFVGSRCEVAEFEETAMHILTVCGKLHQIFLQIDKSQTRKAENKYKIFDGFSLMNFQFEEIKEFYSNIIFKAGKIPTVWYALKIYTIIYRIIYNICNEIVAKPLIPE